MSNGVNNGDKLTGKRHFEDANEFGRRDYMSALGSNKSASKEIELADDEEYIRLQEEEERRVIERAKLEEKHKLEEAKRLVEHKKEAENERKRVEEQLKSSEAERRMLEEEHAKVEEQLRQVEDSRKNDKKKYIAIAVAVLIALGGLLIGNNSQPKPEPKPKEDNVEVNEIKRKEEELQRKEIELRLKEEQMKKQNEELTKKKEQLQKKDEELARVKRIYGNNVDQRQAAAFLIGYFKDIDNKDFSKAWYKLHPSLRQSMFASFDGYKAGFKNTYSQDVKIRRVDLVSSDRATVYFDLYAKDRENGRLVSNNFTGRWDIVKEGGNTFMDNPSVRRM